MMNISLPKLNQLALAFLLGIALSCSNSVSEEKTPELVLGNQEIMLTELQFNTAEMRLGKVEKQAFRESIKARGVLEARPENKVSVSSYFDGYVKETSLLAGQKVAAGQVLFTLENPEYLVIQEQFLEAKSMLEYYKNDFERQKGLAAEKVSSEKKFHQAKADYEVTAAKYGSLKQKLKLMHINPAKLSPETLSSTIKVTAPIDGYISEVKISRGKFLSPSESAVEIVNSEDLKLALTIYERDLDKISLGQELSFSLEKYPSKVFKAKIDLISPAIDLEKRSALVHASFNSKDVEKLNPGTYIEVEIFNDSTSLFSLQREAMVQKGEHYEALVLEKKENANYFFKAIRLDVSASSEEHFGFKLPAKYRDKQFLLNGTFSLLGE